MTFYGSSFIADHRGRSRSPADRESEQVLVQRFDLDAAAPIGKVGVAFEIGGRIYMAP